ncbi:MAG: helix-turn-helix transcriptional regulator [Parvibaculum sp.]
MSDDDLLRNRIAGTLGHDIAYIRRRIAEIRRWGALHSVGFVEEILTANPRLEDVVPVVGRDPLPEEYELAFGFTRAEGEIALLFVLGHSIAEIAKQRGCSVNTVRTQFAHIKDKLGKKTQTDVLRELMKV